MYYRLLKSLDDLVGDVGLLRLPDYIFEDYVFDASRKLAFEKAIRAIRDGKNVLIVGTAGVGKTALMAIIIKHLVELGFPVGYIIEGVESVGREHEDRGIILFYDDFPRMSLNALRSIALKGVRGLLGTSRLEELDELRVKLGIPVSDVFEVVRIDYMGEAYLREILYRFADSEGIRIEEGADEILIEKAGSLPVYIWQAIRDLKLQGQFVLTKSFANSVPSGMLGYVEDILWRILDEHPDRYAVLLTLLVIADLPKYEINSDLLMALFVEALEEFRGSVSMAEIITHELFDRLLKYMIKTDPYTYKLPHDSWGDVLRGRGVGLMSGEISKINVLYPRQQRVHLLRKAVVRAREEIISRLKDRGRILAFDDYVRRIKVEVPEQREVPIRKVYCLSENTYFSRSPHVLLSHSPIYRVMLDDPEIWGLLKALRSDIKNGTRVKYVSKSSAEVVYPTETNIRHRIMEISGKIRMPIHKLYFLLSLLFDFALIYLFVIAAKDETLMILLISLSTLFFPLLLSFTIMTYNVMRDGASASVIIEELSASEDDPDAQEILRIVSQKLSRHTVRLSREQLELLRIKGIKPLGLP